MADEKRSLILDLLARNRMRKDTEEAAGDLDRLGGAAEDADKKTRGLGDTTEKTGKQTDRLGHSLEETKGKISSLDKEINGVKGELAGLHKSFADTSDAAERLDLSKAIRKSEADLRRLTKSKSFLSTLIPDKSETESRLVSFGKSVASTFSTIGESAGTYLVAGLAAAAPLIGASISGAIIGGAGATGIVGGILIATRDSRVQSALSALKTHFGDELKDAAKPFVPITLSGLERIRSKIDQLDLKKIFADAASQSGPLIDGVVHLVDRLGKAFADVVSKSGPEVEALGNGIAQIGDAIGSGLEELANNGKDSAAALNDLFGLISGGITVVFKLVDGLTRVYGALHNIGYDIGTVVGDGLKAVGVHGEEAHGTLMKVSHASIDAADATQSLARAQEADQRAAEGQRDALSEVAKELRKQTDPAFALLDATDQVRKSQKEAAAAVHKYGANSEQARAATRQLAEAAITLQGDVGALGKSFDGHLTPTMRRTLQAAGLTKNQIKGVENELIRARKAANAYAKRYVAEIITNYTYNVGGNDYNREANRGAFSGKRAAGGPIVRGMPYLVGENGPEIVVPDASGRVLSAGASRGLVAQGAVAGMRGQTGGGGGYQTLRLEVHGGDQRLVSLLKYLIRTANLIEA